MIVILFQDRFAEQVREGRKLQTIRKSARCKAGDMLSLRMWSGKPYRSKQKLLATAACTGVDDIFMDNVQGYGFAVWKNYTRLRHEQIDHAAQVDGFKNAEDMAAYFTDFHGLPFKGFLIRWQNLIVRADLGDPLGSYSVRNNAEELVYCKHCNKTHAVQSGEEECSPGVWINEISAPRRSM